MPDYGYKAVTTTPPTNATYVTLSTNGILSDERVLTGGSGITITDGGAGTTATISANSRVLSTITTNADVTNTAAETTLATISIPANILGTGNIVRITLFGNWEANSGSTTVTIRFKYGTTTMYQDTTSSLGATASVAGWAAHLFLSADAGATNDQDLIGQFVQGPRAAVTTGFGDIAAAGGISTIVGGDAAENSTGTLNFTMTVQWATGNSAYHWRLISGVAEILTAA